MKKSDLKNKMVVVLRNGIVYMVVNEILMNVDGFMPLCEYNNDLTYFDDEWDVVKVYQANDDSYGCLNRFIRYSEDDFKLIYEQKKLLTDKEKKWLRSVIKPFRDEVKSINLDKPWNEKKAGYINIKLHNNDSLFTPSFNSLPFKFEGLEFEKDYTLEELGL